MSHEGSDGAMTWPCIAWNMKLFETTRGMSHNREIVPICANTTIPVDIMVRNGTESVPPFKHFIIM